MDNKVLKFTDDTSKKGSTGFGDILNTICAEQKLSRFQLATLIKYSEAAISRVANGSRPFKKEMADRFEEVIGGSSETWMKVYDQTKNDNNTSSVKYFRDLLLDDNTSDSLPGILVRRIHEKDIIEIFGNSDGKMTFRGITEDCEIDPFDASAVKKTSYDTHVGGYLIENVPDKESIQQVEDEVVIPAHESRIIITREHITLPPWLEADINPAWSIGRKGLLVGHGPIIDPGEWSDRLYVNVFNPTSKNIAIKTDEPFITLRFELLNLE